MTPMPDKILDKITCAYVARNPARLMNLMPELMDAIGKTIFEFDEKTSGLIADGVVSRVFAYELLERSKE